MNDRAEIEVTWERHRHTKEGLVPAVTWKRHVQVQYLKTGFQSELVVITENLPLMGLSFPFWLSG